MGEASSVDGERGHRRRHRGGEEERPPGGVGSSPDESNGGAEGTKRAAGRNREASRSATSDHTNGKGHHFLRAGVGLVLFALVLHVFILPLFSNFGDTWSTLTSLDPLLLLAAVGIEGAAWWFLGESHRLLIPRRSAPSGGLMYGITLASNGLSRLIPAGAAAAAGVEFVLLHKARVPEGKITYAYTASGLLSAITLNALLVAAVVIGLFRVERFQSFVVPAVGAALIVAAIVGAVAIALRHTNRTARLIGKAAGWLPKVKKDAVEGWVKMTADRIDELLKDPRRLALLSAVTAGRWIAEATALWVVFAALGSRTDILVTVVAIAVSNIVSIIPISPGGLGIFEATMIGTLVAFGTDHTTATAAVMAFRGISFWLMIPVGAIANVIVNWAIDHHHGLAPGAAS